MLEPSDDTDEAASEFVEGAKRDLYLRCSPYVYFRASVLHSRHYAYGLGDLTEGEYLESRDTILDELVGKPRRTAVPVVVLTIIGLLVAFYWGGAADLTAVTVGIFCVGIWVSWGWWSWQKYHAWMDSLSSATRLDILNALHAEGIIDHDCRDRYARALRATEFRAT